MSDEKIFEMFQNFLDKLQKNTDELQALLRNHETRLTVLETEKKNGIKDKLLEWLMKGLLIALGTIATSAGAASILKPILGM